MASLRNVTKSHIGFSLYKRIACNAFLERGFSSSSVDSADQMNLIRHLRERTSAPIKEVKAALVDCQWNIDEAQKELRKRGKAVASKKSSRTAGEGLLALARDGNKASVIELNCETDFVARNDIFQCLASALAKQVLLVENPGKFSEHITVGPEALEEMRLNLDHPKISGENTVQNAIAEVAAIMGENIKFRRGFIMNASPHGVLSTYLHASPKRGLGRIAGILSLEVENGASHIEAIQHVGSELAMHIVAAKPLFLTKELVSADALENEREILKSQAATTGKSQMAIDKMVEGRMRKYMEEVVLMEQNFVVNDSITVKALIDSLSKEVGSPVCIRNFFRMEVGEGIQQ
ncbi:hypothetical protein SAY87_000850 [Trapa incisa]|uniref:Elongation factor Ts, mitochondrial n=1 Tax=Trapa incisa TaxID=236973 RepID=A0AAN7GJJ5_9MYRT|nr:hypothetical protein SAY87_000850 [Trapa incisa]